MAEPKKKLSRSRSGNRKRWQGLKEPAISYCSVCKKIIAPHRVCPHCGHYRGELIIDKEAENKVSSKSTKEG